MSQELFDATFLMPPLSAKAQAKLLNLPGLDKGFLWQFFLAHKAQAFVILEDALSLLPMGGTWVELLKIIEAMVPNPKPAHD